MRGHVGERAHTEADEDAALDPRVDAPAAVRPSLGGAHLAAVERLLERLEDLAVGRSEPAALRVQLLDLLTQRHALTLPKVLTRSAPRARGPGSAPSRARAAGANSLRAVPSTPSRP